MAEYYFGVTAKVWKNNYQEEHRFTEQISRCARNDPQSVLEGVRAVRTRPHSPHLLFYRKRLSRVLGTVQAKCKQSAAKQGI